MEAVTGRKNFFAVVLIGLLGMFFISGIVHAQETETKKRASFGLILDSHNQRGVGFLDVVKREIRVLMDQEYDVRFDPENIIYTQYDNVKVGKAFDSMFANPDVDIILAFGVMSSAKAYQLQTLPKPVIAPFVVSTKLAQIPFKDGTSGVHNLNYLCVEDKDRDIVVDFADIAGFGKKDRMVLVFDRAFSLAVPELKEELDKSAEQAGVAYDLVIAEESADDVLARIPDGTKAVCLGPVMELSNDEFQKLINELNKRKIPTFSVWGEEAALKGVLASVGPKSDNLLYARRIALNAQRVMFGEDPAGFDVFIPNSGQLFFNVKTASQIGVSPSWDILSRAILVGEDALANSSSSGVLDVKQCVKMALDSNFSILARRKEVQAGRQDYISAVADLLPQAKVGLAGTMIDKDRAEASLGASPEKTLTFSGTLDQLIFSDKVWANKTVQKMFDLGREKRLDGYEQDIVKDTTVAYYTVLQALANERVQKQNLDLTKSNLDLAVVRRNSGVSGPAEVYRWESELAKSQKDLVQAQTERKKAQMQLAALIMKPLEEIVGIKDIRSDEMENLFSQGKLAEYLKNPQRFKTFRDFMVKKGLEYSPEIAAYNYSIKAQQRLLTSARRSYFLPDVTLSAQYNNLLDSSGVGADLGTAPDDDWQVSINGSLDVFTGGAKLADNRQARYTLEQLRFERDDLVRQTETNIRTLLMDAMYSASSIDLSRKEHEAASKNLDVIKDSYSRGTVSILDLLDAQTSALVAAQVAEAAVYDHLMNVVRIKRAAGFLGTRLGAQDKKKLTEEMKAYFKRELASASNVEAEL